ITSDVPIFWGIFGLAFLSGVLAGESGSRSALLERLAQLGVVAVLAVLLYSPYFVGFASQPLCLWFVAERTMFGSLFVLFGPLLFVTFVAGGLAALLLWRLYGAGLPRWLPVALLAVRLLLFVVVVATVGLMILFVV